MLSSVAKKFFPTSCPNVPWNKVRLARCSSDPFVNPNEPSTEELGQPTCQTHPHLLKSGEINPGIHLKEIIERRDRLVAEILRKSDLASHVIIIPSSTVQYMSGKIPYVFRQDNDFRYFSGCMEPDTLLSLIVSNKNSYRSILFTREKNKHTELWEGHRTGPVQAVKHFGVDEAYPMTELSSVLQSELKKLKSFKLWFDSAECQQDGVRKMITSMSPLIKEIESIKPVVHRLRVIKSPSESALMLKAGEIISQSMEESMVACCKGVLSNRGTVTEHQLWAIVDGASRLRGANMLAYPPVVAGGNNANTIHYIANTQAVSANDMILMDAGCDYGGYCSDLSRTWPANGEFSNAQRVLYEVVLSVQCDLIKSLADHPSLDQLLSMSTGLLGNRLASAGVLTSDALTLTPNQIGMKFCPHHVSHYLGMDVHDTPSVPRSISVEDGMVITIEPGVYIDRINNLAKQEFRGVGIRIEDDVLITESQPKVLTTAAKTVNEIENLMKK